MLVLARKVGETVVFSTGLRLTVRAIRWQRVILGIEYDDASLTVTQPLGSMLQLEGDVQVRPQWRSGRGVNIAIDAPPDVLVLREELLGRETAFEAQAAGTRRSCSQR